MRPPRGATMAGSLVMASPLRLYLPIRAYMAQGFTLNLSKRMGRLRAKTSMLSRWLVLRSV